jgi:hypothetical protein
MGLSSWEMSDCAGVEARSHHLGSTLWVVQRTVRMLAGQYLSVMPKLRCRSKLSIVSHHQQVPLSCSAFTHLVDVVYASLARRVCILPCAFFLARGSLGTQSSQLPVNGSHGSTWIEWAHG